MAKKGENKISQPQSVEQEQETKQQETQKKTTQKKQPKPTYVHIDEFFRQKGDKLDDNEKRGFKIFMKGKTYQRHLDDFEKELSKFRNRKI